jgi:nitrate reductase NapE component
MEVTNQLSITKELIPVLAVALVTWGGVLVYLFRLQVMVKSLEDKVADRELEVSSE